MDTTKPNQDLHGSTYPKPGPHYFNISRNRPRETHISLNGYTDEAKFVPSLIRKRYQHDTPQSQTILADCDQISALESLGGSIASHLPDTAGWSSCCNEEVYDHDADAGKPDCREKSQDGEEAFEEFTATAPISLNVGSEALFRHQQSIVDDIHFVGQWYFISQMSESDHLRFRSAQKYWVEGLWDMALVSRPMYAVMRSYSLHKKAVMSGSKCKFQYYVQKGRLIQDISADLHESQGRPCPFTIVAIAILGYLEIRDAEFEAAGTHLRAVCKFIEMSRLSLHAWLYCVWSDLRYALFTRNEPYLPFYIPAACRQLPASMHFYCREASQRGSINASECPRSPLLTLDMARDIFCNLQALCYCSDTLKPADEPPFGQIYTLEYGLRVVQARAHHSQDDMLVYPAVLLVTSAIQLHVWMASRFWTPQRCESHFALMRHACEVMASCDDLVTQWHISAGLESLLWVLFTIVATLRAHDRQNVTAVLRLLHEVLRKSNITCCEHMELRLKRWPWLNNWHSKQIEGVWALLCAGHPELVLPNSHNGAERTQQDPHNARRRWFVGGLEFFHDS